MKIGFSQRERKGNGKQQEGETRKQRKSFRRFSGVGKENFCYCGELGEVADDGNLDFRRKISLG